MARRKKHDDYKITALEGLAAVRKVPGMYIGDTDNGEGFHHMLMEVLDNSVDEYLAGHCNKIVVTLHKDGSASVGDNGRGIPVYYMKEKKMTALEVVFRTLHAGGKFDDSNYKVSGGLHGVGVSVVNALSARLKVVVRRDGKEYSMIFEKGKKVEDITEQTYKGKESGTFIRFAADLAIFKGVIRFDPSVVRKKLMELSFLCRGLSIEFIDEIKDKSELFGGENDMSGFIKYLSKGRLLEDPIIFTKDVELNDKIIVVDIAMQWTNGSSDAEIYRYYTNNIPNADGGSHMFGFRAGLTRTMNSYISNSDLPKSLKISLSGDDIREGLVSVVSIRYPDPKFNSQVKSKLVSEDARTAVESTISDQLMGYLEQNPPIAKKIITRCVNSYKAREAARKAREAVRKSSLESGAGLLPGKLADCQERDPEKCELFIVEGNSAGGCFAGNTKVSLTDGRELSMKELVDEFNSGRQNYCYSVEENGSVCIRPIKDPRITRRSCSVIELTLESGETIVCTPDHKFMLVDGSYERADKLCDKSIMPLYRKMSRIEGRVTISGYEMVWDRNTHKWIFTHVLADKYNQLAHDIGKKAKNECLHHIDFIKTNNDPTNIRRIDKDKHLQLHYENLKRTLHRPDVIEKCRQLKRTPEFRKKMSERMRRPETARKLSMNAKLQWQDEEHKAYMVEAVKKYNHKIVKIVQLKNKVDVYDFEVPGTNNFALSCGVFVHNSAKQARDRRFQAILPLRGKVLNIEKKEFKNLVDNKELASLIAAIGAGIGKSFNPDNIRYNKILIMTDSDVDGAHIRTLLLTFFFRQMPQLIVNGNLFIARPPLYKLTYRNNTHYVQDNSELKSFIKRHNIKREKIGNGFSYKGVKLQRFKGLGEMNPAQLWETAMDPETRKISVVTIDNYIEADKIFGILMGNDVGPRRDFVQNNSDLAENIDI